MKQKPMPLIFGDPKELERYFAAWELQTRQFAHELRKGVRSKSNLRKAKTKMRMASA